MFDIIVLLSTYNGEKFLKQQIDSILNQNVNVGILIRDDGSTDDTINIIKQYNDSRIQLIEGNNIGVQKSFFELIRIAPIANYYAFCDQDDVWLDTKLETAISMLEKVDGIGLYMSNYDVVDEKLNFIQKSDFHFEYPHTLRRTIVRGCPSGCTMVFNNELREVMANHKPQYYRMHDYWTLLTVEALHGTIVCDEESQILYRQHQNNTVGFDMSIMTHVKRWINLFKSRDGERYLQAMSLLNAYIEILPEDSLEVLHIIEHYKDSFSNKWNMIFKSGCMPKELEYKILFFFSILCGKF